MNGERDIAGPAESGADALQFGSAAQHKWLSTLSLDAGFEGPAAAAAAMMPGHPVAGGAMSVPDASKLITLLQQKLGMEPGTGKPADNMRARFLTARTLRRIALGEEAVPPVLDEHARWVLDRLVRFEAIQRLSAIDSSQSKKAINGDGPIETATLVEHWGSEEAAAVAFGVALGTWRAYGAHLPAAHAFKAEVLTGGLVRAPR